VSKVGSALTVSGVIVCNDVPNQRREEKQRKVSPKPLW